MSTTDESSAAAVGGCAVCAACASATPLSAPRMLAFGSYSLPAARVGVFAAAAGLWIAGIVLELLNFGGYWAYLPLLPFVAAYALAGAPVLADAARNLARGKPFDENFLMSIATIGAFAIGEWEEAVGVMIFFMIGELVQEAAVLKSRRSIDALLALKPDSARVADGASWIEVRPETVPVGSVVLVRPGERIPLDGRVEEGEGLIDAAALTGESVPVRVGPGAEVRAGTVAVDGVLRIITTKIAGESSAARIVDMVENASRAKARAERFITVFARVYTPLVVFAAAGVAVLPPLLWSDDSFSVWLYRALIMLVISCPCALVVSVPLGYFGGIGGMSRRGILVKGATYLDSLAKARMVAFDKTGTLTEGAFTVRAVEAYGVTHGAMDDALPEAAADRLLALASAAESHSNHPVGRAIVEAAEKRGVSFREPDAGSLRETAGYGIEATIDGMAVLVGNERLLTDRGVEIPHDAVPMAFSAMGAVSTVLVASDGRFQGWLVIGDKLKEHARAAVDELRGLGVERFAVLSGDSQGSVDAVADELKIGERHAGLLPEGKLALVESYTAGTAGTLFVGDGINDAPVLARADVGIAMGSGADAAVEAADVILMTDDPRRVAEAIRRARRTRRIVTQNIVFALVFKVGFLTLGAFGLATMWAAVVADVGVALIAVLNSTRALK